MRTLFALTCCCALAACAQDGDLLYVRTAAVQPDDPGYGRLLSIFASSGDRNDDDHDTQLQIRVSGGTLKSVADLDPTPEICVVVKKKELHEEKIAVVPIASESLVLAVLRDQDSAGSCAGTMRTQLIVPVQRVGEQMSIDAAVVPPSARHAEGVTP